MFSLSKHSITPFAGLELVTGVVWEKNTIGWLELVGEVVWEENTVGLELELAAERSECGMTYFKRRIQTPPTTKLNSTKHRAMLLLREPGRSKSEIW